MKFSMIISFLIFCFMGFSSYSQNKPDRVGVHKGKEEPVMQQEVPPVDQEKIEIDPSELPEEVHIEVRDNYYNGDIFKAYKLMKDGKIDGYIAEVKNGPREWNLRFDSEGNALNKVIPNK